MQFSAKTIERWYYKARAAHRDPVGALRKAIRKDAGRQVALRPGFVQLLLEQYQQHPNWSVKLHLDNLRVRVEEEPDLGPMPGYSTVVRFMRARGLNKKRRRNPKGRPGLLRAEARLTRREVRSYEDDGHARGRGGTGLRVTQRGHLRLGGDGIQPHARFGNLRRPTVGHARWNLRCVHLVDPHLQTQEQS